MKVVQINSVCGVGSTGRIAIDISKKLNDNNIENYILYGVGESDYPNAIKFGGKLNVKMHQINTRLFGKHAFYSKKATQELVKRLKEINPDIVHLHNIHGHYLNIEILFNYLIETNKKVIWTLHDCWSFTGHCAHFDFINCRRWENGCYKCPQLNEYPKSLLFDRSKESFIDKKRIFTSVNNMLIVTPSHWLASLVKQSFLKKYPIQIINNGIDLDLFKPNVSNFRKNYNIENKFIILGVASIWGMKKGYSYFLQLAKELNDDEVIVLIGLSEGQMYNLPDNVIGITRTNSISELAAVYSAADVFVNPTLEDNFPTTNLEALACGTPVITFNTGGSIESIDNSCGIVVKKGVNKELMDGIKIIKNKRKESYSSKCVQRAVNYYDKNDRYNDYLELYINVN